MKVYENCALLGRYAASGDNLLPTFQDNIGPIFRGQELFFFILDQLKMGPVVCAETSVRN